MRGRGSGGAGDDMSDPNGTDDYDKSTGGSQSPMSHKSSDNEDESHDGVGLPTGSSSKLEPANSHLLTHHHGANNSHQQYQNHHLHAHHHHSQHGQLNPATLNQPNNMGGQTANPNMNSNLLNGKFKFLCILQHSNTLGEFKLEREIF